jgi:hypothetical protein
MADKVWASEKSERYIVIPWTTPVGKKNRKKSSTEIHRGGGVCDNQITGVA